MRNYGSLFIAVLASASLVGCATAGSSSGKGDAARNQAGTATAETRGAAVGTADAAGSAEATEVKVGKPFSAPQSQAATVTAATAIPEETIIIAASGEELARARDVERQLRDVESMVRRGESSAMRQKIIAFQNSHPDDRLTFLLMNWLEAPSEASGTTLNALAKQYPEEPWFGTALARIYLSWSGFVDVADQELGRTLAAHPDFLPALATRGEILRQSGKVQEAVDAFQKVLASDPDCYLALLGLSNALESQEKFQEAETALARALQVDDRDPVLLRRMAAILEKRGDGDALLGLYEKLLDIYPGDTAIQLSLGKLRLEKGDLEGASRDLEGISTAHNSPEILGILLDIYRKLERPDDQLRVLELLVKLNPGATVDNFVAIAHLKRAGSDFEGAAAAIASALDLAEDRLDLRAQLARDLAAGRKTVDAILAYRKAILMGAADLSREAKELERASGVPARPITGNVERLYNQSFYRLQKELESLQKSNPALGGEYGVRFTISEEGTVTKVEVVHDTVHDDRLRTVLYFSLLDAKVPGEQPRTLSIEYELLTKKQMREQARKNR